MEKGSKVKIEVKRFLFCTAGAALIAFNLKSFVNAGGLFPSGFSGITLLVQQICSTFFHFSIPYTAVYIPLNLLPIYIGIRYLGKKFTLYSIYVIALSSILTDLLPAFTVTNADLYFRRDHQRRGGLSLPVRGRQRGRNGFHFHLLFREKRYRRLELYFHGQCLHPGYGGRPFRI